MENIKEIISIIKTMGPLSTEGVCKEYAKLHPMAITSFQIIKMEKALNSNKDFVRLNNNDKWECVNKKESIQKQDKNNDDSFDNWSNYTSKHPILNVYSKYIDFFDKEFNGTDGMDRFAEPENGHKDEMSKNYKDDKGKLFMLYVTSGAREQYVSVEIPTTRVKNVPNSILNLYNQNNVKRRTKDTKIIFYKFDKEDNNNKLLKYLKSI